VSGFAHDVAAASLPVAIGLAVLAGAARLVLWAQVDDVRAQRVARQYLGPLTTWCLVAVATNSLAVGAAGEASVVSLALPAVLGGAAVLLRPAAETPVPGGVEPEQKPPKRRATVDATAPERTPAAYKPAATTRAAQGLAPASPDAPAPARALWAGGDEESNGRLGLWSR
jgi:hypothetical protein